MKRNGMNSNVSISKSNNQMVDEIIKMGKEHSSITLLYGTKEERFNNAVALKEYLEEKTK